MSKVTKHLFTELIIGILVMTIPIFLLSLGFLYFQSQHFIFQEALKKNNSILNTTMHQVRNKMDLAQTAADALQWIIEEHFAPDSLKSYSHRLVQDVPGVISCSIGARPGYLPNNNQYFLACSTQEGDSIVTTGTNAKDYIDEPWYQVPVNAGHAGWMEPTTTESHISYNLPIYARQASKSNGERQLKGVISIKVPLHVLAKSISQQSLPYPNAYYILISHDGRYLIHPDATKVNKKTIFSSNSQSQQNDIIALGHEMTNGKTGTVEVSINGTRCHVCYLPMHGTNWSLALICQDNDILQNYHQLGSIITILILIGLLLIIIRGHFVVNKAVRPLKMLLDQTQQISNGHYDVMIANSDKQDVISRLQNSFSIMQQSLDEHMSGLEKTIEETRIHNKKMEEAMRLAEESVRQKTLFIQNVSHQIRTPLNIVLGFANVLKESIASTDDNTSSKANESLSEKELEELSFQIKHNAIHLNRITLMLYDSSESGVSKVVKLNKDDVIRCNDVARECIDYVKKFVQDAKVEFQTTLPDEHYIRSNYLYTMRTLRELLFNAAKYADVQHIKVSISITSSFVRFTVEDIGPGLSDNEQEFLFTPFTKADDLSEGLGLGLPLCKLHANNLGGDLTLDKSYHNGCRFFFDIPDNAMSGS